MERVELYCQERPRGEITLDPRGSRTRVRALSYTHLTLPPILRL